MTNYFAPASDGDWETWNPADGWDPLAGPDQYWRLRDRAGREWLSPPGEPRQWGWLCPESPDDIVAHQRPINWAEYNERHAPRLAQERRAKKDQIAAQKAEAKAERARHRPLPDNQLRAYVLEQLDRIDAATEDPDVAFMTAAMRATINGKPPK